MTQQKAKILQHKYNQSIKRVLDEFYQDHSTKQGQVNPNKQQVTRGQWSISTPPSPKEWNISAVFMMKRHILRFLYQW